MAQFAAGNRLGQGVLPVPEERLRLDIEEQSAGQAETEHEEFQRLDPQQGQCLVEVRNLAAESKERTIDDAEDAAGNGRIVLDALFQGPRIDVGVPRELQNLHGNPGQTVELPATCYQLVEGCRGIDHAGLALQTGGCGCLAIAETTSRTIRDGRLALPLNSLSVNVAYGRTKHAEPAFQTNPAGGDLGRPPFRTATPPQKQGFRALPTLNESSAAGNARLEPARKPFWASTISVHRQGSPTGSRSVRMETYLRCRIRDRIRRFLRPSFRRPLPVFLTPTRHSIKVVRCCLV